MNSRVVIGMVGFYVALTLSGAAESPAPLKALARMPVKEVTVFKDGHAFVLHSGTMPTDESGNVVMDYLPAPVIGTFWPFCADKKAKLSAVTASQSKVLVERTALTVRELVEANIGAEVVVAETGGPNYDAVILDIPARSGDEQEAINPPNSGERLTEKGVVVLLKTEGGVKAVNLDRIQDIRFTGAYDKTLPHEEYRNLLTLKLDWEKGNAQKDADVGLLYLQRGLRWIPNYKVVVDGKGRAVVTLQATLINELADLDDVAANLVIGVPTFAFKETVDPMSLQQTVAQLSQYFRQDAQTAYAFSNAIMTQQRMPADTHRGRPAEGAAGMDLGPDVANSGQSEDLFVFSVKHITLKKGQRMVMPVGEFILKYEDVFALDIPFAPPSEVWRNFDSGRRGELATLFSTPKVMHKIRLFNDSAYPLTTAPALILKDNRILAQGLMTYASPGSESDLNITVAVDIRVKKSDNETQRTPNTTTWQGDQYGRVDLAGTITLTHFRTEPIEVEITRSVLGNVDSADSDGKTEMVNIFEESAFGGDSGAYPHWWGWFSWPWWWHHFNGMGRVSWTVQIEPKKPVDLGYTWNYYWR